jgi:hypothetical protein
VSAEADDVVKLLTHKLKRTAPVRYNALLALLVSKFISKFLGHVELRNAENAKSHSENNKKQIWTVISNVVQTEKDQGQAHYH